MKCPVIPGETKQLATTTGRVLQWTLLPEVITFSGQHFTGVFCAPIREIDRKVQKSTRATEPTAVSPFAEIGLFSSFEIGRLDYAAATRRPAERFRLIRSDRPETGPIQSGRSTHSGPGGGEIVWTVDANASVDQNRGRSAAERKCKNKKIVPRKWHKDDADC